MNSFEYKVIERTPITHGMLRIIRQISEYRGKQELYKIQSPQVLETLRQAAVIQSTECSNRIEGVTAPLARIKDLVAHKTTPRNRSEQEIAGYRDVLGTVHANAPDMKFTKNLVLQLHRDLYQFLPGEGGLVETGRGTKTAMVLDVIDRMPGDFSIGDIQGRCPTVGIDMLRRILRQQRDAGKLMCTGRGPNARWRKNG